MRHIGFILTIVLGLIIGLLASQVVGQSSSSCASLESSIAQNQSFNGSAACYRPGVLDINLSDKIEENSDLKCVCRVITDGNIQVLPVAKSR